MESTAYSTIKIRIVHFLNRSFVLNIILNQSSRSFKVQLRSGGFFPNTPLNEICGPMFLPPQQPPWTACFGGLMTIYGHVLHSPQSTIYGHWLKRSSIILAFDMPNFCNLSLDFLLNFLRVLISISLLQN